MRSVLIGALILCWSCVFSASVFSTEPIRITNGEWPPYLSKELKHYGVVSHIVTKAFELAGVEVKYDFFTWKRSFDQAKVGRRDGTAVWFRSAEREKYFYISDPVVDAQYVYFHLKSFPFDWNTIDDLKGMTIGGTKGYNYGDAFMNAEKLNIIKVQRTPKDELNFKKMLKDRIQIFPNDLDVGYDMLRKLFSPQKAALFTHHPKPVKSDPLHLLLSKKIKRNQSMIDLFNKGLTQLKKSGQYEQMLKDSREGMYFIK